MITDPTPWVSVLGVKLISRKGTTPHAADPDVHPLLRTQRRSLQMVLRLLAFNAEAWLAERLNVYLQDNDEYRATLRHLGGQIHYTPHTITVTLYTPTTPKITRVLSLLFDEFNTHQPRIPGDPRSITYRLQQG
jgi:hypothetical protein